MVKIGLVLSELPIHEGGHDNPMHNFRGFVDIDSTNLLVIINLRSTCN